jgi:hypothetical protein
MSQSADFSQMTAQQFEEWKATNAPSFAGVRQETPGVTPEDVKASYAAARALSGGNLAPGGVYDPSPSASGDPKPSPAPSAQARPAAEVWGSNEYDFTCPSGAQCRMRKLMPEKLLEMGVLDKITALPGYTDELIKQAEGAPPERTGAASTLPDKEELQQIVDLLEVLVPMVVVTPTVYPAPVFDEGGKMPDRVEGRIYTDSIELQDRVAIMERAVHGVKPLATFRQGSV